MKERIILFLQTENKSSVQFAQEIGVQPSSISHIISGRNNPSLDFVLKMLTRYPSLSADWLLFGKGEMIRDNIVSSLFDSSLSLNMSANNIEPSKSIISDHGTDNEPFNERSEISEKDKSRINTQFRKANRIVCFFDNNTYTEYFPGAE